MDNNKIYPKEFPVDKGYEKHLPLWEHVRAAVNGKQGVIKMIATGGYFGLVAPMYRRTPENYKQVTERELKYFARGRFFNATGRTHDAYRGMISKLVEQKLPAQLEPMIDDCDGAKTTLNDFAIEMASEVIQTSRYAILVDPPSVAGSTLANMSTPSFKPYRAEHIGRVIVQNGKVVEVPLMEHYWHKKDGEWRHDCQIRVLQLIDGYYVSTVYRDGEMYEQTEALINGSRMDYIPIVFCGAENNKPTYDRLVMFDLAHQNLGHFQLDCDNRENLHYHGQGMTNIYTNMTPDEFLERNPDGMDVGAKGLNQLNTDDRVELLQLDASGAIPAEMLRDEKRMIMLGAQVVQDSGSTQTLGAKEIEANAATSQLHLIANNCSEALTTAGKYAAEMIGANQDEVAIKLNSNFVTDTMTSQDVAVMFQMVQQGAATMDELNEVKRRANYTNKTNEELKDALDDEAVTQGDSEEVAMLKMEIDNLKASMSGESAADGDQ